MSVSVRDIVCCFGLSTCTRSKKEPSLRDAKEKIPMDYNIYNTRKTVAQGMMDIALLTANAAQLKYMLSHSETEEYFVVTVIMLGISITFQIMAGVMLIFLGRWNLNRFKDQRKSDLLNNAIIVIVFLITVVNVLISAFGADSIEEDDHQWTTVYKGHHQRPSSLFDKKDFSPDKNTNRYERAIVGWPTKNFTQ